MRYPAALNGCLQIGSFLDQYYGRKPANDQKNPGHTESKCFLRMFEEIVNLK